MWGLVGHILALMVFQVILFRISKPKGISQSENIMFVAQSSLFQGFQLDKQQLLLQNEENKTHMCKDSPNIF